MKKFFHASTIKILLLSVVIFIIAIFSPIKPTLATPQKPFQINVIFDRPVYQKGDTIKATIALQKVSTDAPTSLRIYIALKDLTGKTLAYRNRFVSRFTGNSATVEASFNTSNLKISGDFYTIEVSVFAAGKPVQTYSTLVITSKNPQMLQIVYFVRVQMPYRLLENDTLADEKPIEYIVKNQNLLNLLRYLKDQKIPVMIAVSSSTLLQIQKLFDGYKLKTEDGIKEFAQNSPQVSLIRQLKDLLESLLSSPHVNVVLFPFGDVSPVSLYDYDLASESIERIEKANLFLKKKNEKANFKGFVYLPYGGIRKDIVSELSKNGFSCVVEQSKAGQKSVLVENTIVLFVESLKTDSDPHEAAVRIMKEHLSKNKAELKVIDITAWDYKYATELTNELKKYPFISFVSQPPFNIQPETSIVESNPNYGDFKTLVPALFKNYKSAKKMLETYLASFVVEDSKKQSLEEILENSVLLAFNPPSDYDTAFRNLKTLRENIGNEFKKIKVYPSKISFTSLRAQLPIYIINKSGKPVKCYLKLSGQGVSFLKNQRKIVLNSNENVYTFPIKIEKSGDIKVKVQLISQNGEMITSGFITVRSNFKAVLVSATLFIFALLGGLIWLRNRIARRVAKNV